jgi:hypothetical protein
MVTITLAQCATFLKRLISNLLPFLAKPTQQFNGKVVPTTSFLLGDLDHLENTSYLGFMGGNGPTATADAATYTAGAIAIATGSGRATGDATKTSAQFDVSAFASDNLEQARARATVSATGQTKDGVATAFAQSSSYASTLNPNQKP